MDNVALEVAKRVVEEARRNGNWVLRAKIGSSEVVATITWEPKEVTEGDSTDTTEGEVRYMTLAAWQDFRAFWRVAGGKIEES